jgi:hypothetical protein
MGQFQIWVAILGVLVMAGGLGGIYYLIVKQNAVIGAQTLQLVSVVFILPLMIVLGSMNVLRSETIGPIIGVIVGFVLAGGGRKD